MYMLRPLYHGSRFLIFGLPLYVLKHLIRYKMGSNLIYFIHLIHYSVYCYKHLHYQKQILQEQSNLLYQLFGLVFGDCFWFSVDSIHFKRSKSVYKDGFIVIFSIHPTKYIYL